MATIKPFQDDIEDKSLHSVWTKELYKFLRDFFSTVEMGPAEDFDDEGNPIIHREPGTGKGWTIPTGEGGGGYSGMFALVDATEYPESGAPTVYTVRVTEGIAHCNGKEVEIDDFEDTIASGTRTYYLLGAIRPASGDYAADLTVVVGYPTGTAGVWGGVPLGYEVGAKLLLGKATVDAGGLSIQQDYLAGSSNQLIIGESCE